MLVLRIIVAILLSLIIFFSLIGMLNVSAENTNRDAFNKIMEIEHFYIKDGLLEDRNSKSIACNILCFFIYMIMQLSSIYFCYQNSHLIIMYFTIVITMLDLSDIFLHYVIKRFGHRNIFMTQIFRKAIITDESKYIKRSDVMWMLDSIFAGVIAPAIYIFGIF